MTPPKQLILFKALPSCPVGTKFYLSLDETYYYNDTSDNELKPYCFSVNETLNSIHIELSLTFFVHISTYINYNHQKTMVKGGESMAYGSHVFFLERKLNRPTQDR